MTRLVSLLPIFLSLGLSSAFVGPTALRTAVVRPDVLSLESSRRFTRAAKVPVKEPGFISKVSGCVRKSVCCVKPVTIGKYMGSLESIVGLVAYVRADIITDFLGLKSSPSSKIYMRMKGLFSMAAGITTVLTVFKGMKAVEAFGYGMIPLVVGCVAEYITGDMNKEMKLNQNLLLMGALVTSGAIYSCLTGASWAMPVMKAIAALYGLEGLAMIFNPKWYMGLFGSNTHLDDGDHKMAARIVGATEVHYGILAGALALGVSATKALGYSLFPYFLFSWWALYSDTAEILSLNKGAIGTSAVVIPLATAALLL